jgi:hypothetical protein
MSLHITEQEEHHRKRSYSEDLKLFVERYGLSGAAIKPLKRLK